ncbi:MAG TPA: hypothetical protein VHC95_07105 [Opitutales bacterium]|nr:hypothetical protein [Opitutales bacterium]
MKLPYKKIILIRAALNALDGREKTVEVKGQTSVIVKPFKFSGKTRLKIARNLRAVEGAFQDYDTARIGLVRENAKPEEDRVADDKLAQFNKQHEELLESTAEVTLDPLAEGDLNLDDNEIPHGALAVLLEFLIPPAAAN